MYLELTSKICSRSIFGGFHYIGRLKLCEWLLSLGKCAEGGNAQTKIYNEERTANPLGESSEISSG